MTPAQYRQKWNLPSIYPMVAPNYTARRSALAKSIGLGQLRKKPVAAVPAKEAVAAVSASAGTTEGVASEPASVAAPERAAVKRKPGRSRVTDRGNVRARQRKTV
jgi:hypothetical protein